MAETKSAVATDPRAKRRRTIYLAAPLFTQTERRTNRLLAAGITEHLSDCRVILPQDFKVSGKYNDRSNYRQLFSKCIAALDSAQAVVALLDGADADSGVSFEVGYAYARRIPVLGVRTDYRAGQDRGVNMMLSRAADRFVFDMAFQEDPQALARAIATKLKVLLPA